MAAFFGNVRSGRPFFGKVFISNDVGSVKAERASNQYEKMMTDALRQQGNSKASDEQLPPPKKPNPQPEVRMLTPAEQESLRQDKKAAAAWMMERLKDVPRLID